MYNVDEIVLYGSNGVCKIKEITRQKLAGKTMEYYVLKPLFSQVSTLFVPTNNEALVSKMRHILPEDRIKDIIDNLSVIPEWIDDKNKRFDYCKETIANGEFEAVVNLIRMLRFHEKEQNNKGRHLHISDERFLREAESMVCDEIAVALNIERSEIIPMLLK
ncbi:MAG: hypothetical protein J1E85_05155 [Ruminococcus sp.]|nr:hypothetical protein [Ruminococcus sp.]